MPIDRPDGRHWCAPDQETPDANGQWACPCGQQWVFSTDAGYPLWETPTDHAERLTHDAPTASPEVV